MRRRNEKYRSNRVEIPYAWRRVVAETIATVLRELGYEVWIVSVSDKHAHILAELPIDLPDFNRIVGRCKSKSSRALKPILPGRVWARGDKHKLVRDRAYRHNAFKYLRDDQGAGAVSWHLDTELCSDR